MSTTTTREPDFVDLLPSKSLDSGSCEIAEDTHGVLRHSLARDYKDIWNALGEFVRNGIDAQRAAGRPELPVLVDFADGTLSITDRGTGMDREFLTHRYTRFNDSPSSELAEANGHYGLGAKSGIALTPVYTVASTQGGWTSTIAISSSAGDIRWDLLSHEHTPGAPDGTTVRLDVSEHRGAEESVRRQLVRMVTWNPDLDIRLNGERVEGRSTVLCRIPEQGAIIMTLQGLGRNFLGSMQGQTRARMNDNVYDLLGHEGKIVDNISIVLDVAKHSIDVNNTRETTMSTPRNEALAAELLRRRDLALDTWLSSLHGADDTMAQAVAKIVDATSELGVELTSDTLCRHSVRGRKVPERIFGTAVREVVKQSPDAKLASRAMDDCLHLDTFLELARSHRRPIVVHHAGASSAAITRHTNRWLRDMDRMEQIQRGMGDVCDKRTWRPAVFTSQGESGSLDWLEWGPDDRRCTLVDYREVLAASQASERAEREAKKVAENTFQTSEGEMTPEQVAAFGGTVVRVDGRYRMVEHTPWLAVRSTQARWRKELAGVEHVDWEDTFEQAIELAHLPKALTDTFDMSLLVYGAVGKTLLALAPRHREVKDPVLRKVLRLADRSHLAAVMTVLSTTQTKESYRLPSALPKPVEHAWAWASEPARAVVGTTFECARVSSDTMSLCYPMLSNSTMAQITGHRRQTTLDHLVGYLNMAHALARRNGDELVPVAGTDEEGAR